MKNQENSQAIVNQDIWGESWDFLIILDACRYDFFEKTYKKYFTKGSLKKVRSFSSNAPRTLTIDWLNKNFTKNHEDIIFLSSNPIINSKIPWKDSQGLSFSGKDTFYKVIDLWDSNWNDKYGTVFPDEFSKALFKEKKKNPKKRFILDVMQPHYPYIGKNYRKYFLKKEDELEKKEKIFNREKSKKERKNNLKETFQKKIRSPIAELIKKNLGDELSWKLMKLFKIKPKASWTLIGIQEGMSGIRRAYEENLEFALSHISTLSKNLKGRIVITADHGEYLGEKGFLGHGKNPPHSEVITDVPWFVINN
ncbi:hypothetical protein CMI47_15305 [Candidatus Pacearchaeota archaeon]|nr:hypothetical protein [Candidatus Pacearchaeota archaeon]|tara:strand:- start:7687 stop:8613 length:927 start_codon:yes stop_codon:yes gene_type:complete